MARNAIITLLFLALSFASFTGMAADMPHLESRSSSFVDADTVVLNVWRNSGVYYAQTKNSNDFAIRVRVCYFTDHGLPRYKDLVIKAKDSSMFSTTLGINHTTLLWHPFTEPKKLICPD